MHAGSNSAKLHHNIAASLLSLIRLWRLTGGGNRNFSFISSIHWS